MNLRILSLSFILASFAATPIPAAILTDSTGDTFGVSPLQHDILSVETTENVVDGTVRFVVNLAGPIAAPSSASQDAIVGFIIIDTNSDADISNVLFDLRDNIPDPGNNIDFYVDLGAELVFPGTVDLLDRFLAFVGSIDITYDATSFSFEIPLASLGASFSELDIGVVVGNTGYVDGRTTFPPEATDQAPDVSAAVPEPASLVVWAIMGIGTSVVWRRRRSGNLPYKRSISVET